MIVPNLSRQPGQESQKDELIASFAEITRVLAEIPRLVKEAEQPELVMAALVFVVVFVGLSLTVIGFWLFYRDRRGPPASPTQNGVSANEMTLSVSLEATLVEHGSEHPQRHHQTSKSCINSRVICSRASSRANSRTSSRASRRSEFKFSQRDDASRKHNPPAFFKAI